MHLAALCPYLVKNCGPGGVRIFDSFVSSFSDMFTDECRVTSFSSELLMSEACQVTADESC